MEDGDYNYTKAYRKMMDAMENHRTIEEIGEELQNELRVVKEESLLVHAMRLIIELDTKATSPLYEHLQSPMRQTLYLIDVYYSIAERSEQEDVDEERWTRIAKLLDEKEMTDFLKEVRRQLVEVRIRGIEGIVDADGDDLLIDLAGVLHLQNPDRAAAHKRSRQDRLGGDDHHVQRVLV